MKKIILIPTLMMMSLLVWGIGYASDQTMKIIIENPWARVSFSGGNSAAYMVIKNNQNSLDTLIGASTDVAKAAEVHNVIMQNNMMMMRPAGNVDIKTKSSLELKPGSFHIMLINLIKDLNTKDSINLTLTFKKAGKVTVQVPVSQEPMPAGQGQMPNGHEMTNPHANQNMGQGGQSMK